MRVSGAPPDGTHGARLWAVSAHPTAAFLEIWSERTRPTAVLSDPEHIDAQAVDFQLCV